MLVKLEWLGYRTVKKNCDDMLSRFHLIPERNGQTDRRTDLLYQYRASVCWRAIRIDCSRPHLRSMSRASIHALCHWYFVNSPKSFKLVPFESLGAVSYSLSMVTMGLSCMISEIKRHNGRKSWFFSYPLPSTPPFVGSPSEYCHAVWYGISSPESISHGSIKTLSRWRHGSWGSRSMTSAGQGLLIYRPSLNSLLHQPIAAGVAVFKCRIKSTQSRMSAE